MFAIRRCRHATPRRRLSMLFSFADAAVAIRHYAAMMLLLRHAAAILPLTLYADTLLLTMLDTLRLLAAGCRLIRLRCCHALSILSMPPAADTPCHAALYAARASAHAIHVARVYALMPHMRYCCQENTLLLFCHRYFADIAMPLRAYFRCYAIAAAAALHMSLDARFDLRRYLILR